MDEIEPLIDNPCRLSMHLIELVMESKREYDAILRPSGWFKDIVNGVRLRLWYLEKHRDILVYARDFHIDDHSIRGLFARFSEMSGYITLNNMLMMYASLKGRHGMLLTREEMKLNCLRMLHEGRMTAKEFLAEYGHHAINGFELSSRRFCEYSEKELRQVARLSRNFHTDKATTLDSYIAGGGRDRFKIYTALREELRHKALLIVKELRFALLGFARAKRIKGIFSHSYEEVLEMLDGGR